MAKQRTRRKNPHAVAMGRIGGKGMTPAKWRAVRAAAKFAGRKPAFRVQRVEDGRMNLCFMEAYDRETRDWSRVIALYPPAMVVLAKWLKEHAPKFALTAFDPKTGLITVG